MRRSERGEGNHFALGVAEEPFFHVFRNHAERRVALHVHLFDAALVEEVVRVGAAPDGRERRVDVGQAQAERARLLTVDVDAQLRLVFLPVGTHGHQILVLGGHAEKLVTGLQKRLMPEAGLVLQLEVETGRVAEFHNGGRRECEHLRIADFRERRHGALGHGVHLEGRVLTLAPVLEAHEGHSHVLAVAREAEPENAHQTVDGFLFLFEEVAFDPLQHLGGLFLRRAGGQLDLGEQHALVLIGQEARGQGLEHEDQAADKHQVDDHETARAPDDVGHAGLVAQRGAVEPAVEPAEEAVLRMHVIPADGFQHRGAEGRGQHDGDHHRQHHGRNDGHRELPVDDAHGPAEEGHGDEHGGQHHSDADQSAGDLIHGFPGGLFG